MVSRNEKISIIHSFLNQRYTPSYSNMKIYLRELYKNIFKRSNKRIDSYTFHEITLWPLFISDKIYRQLNTSHQNKLTSNEFVNGILNLFFSKREAINEILFNILDFNNDKTINIEDVNRFFSYFHMLNLNLSSEASMKEIIEKFFNGQQEIDFKEYSNRMWIDFDWYYWFIIYLRKFTFFNFHQVNHCIKSLDFGSNIVTSTNATTIQSTLPSSNKCSTWIENNVNNNGNTNDNTSDSHIITWISEECIDYACWVIQSMSRKLVTTELDDIETLNQWDNFEKDIGKVINKYDEISNNWWVEQYSNNFNSNQRMKIRMSKDYQEQKHSAQLTNFFQQRRNGMSNDSWVNTWIYANNNTSNNIYWLNNQNKRTSNTNKSSARHIDSEECFQKCHTTKKSSLLTLNWLNNGNCVCHSSSSTLKNNIEVNMSRSHSQQYEFKLYTWKKSNKIALRKIVIINNNIFYYHCTNDNGEYYMKKIVLLSQTFPKKGECFVIDQIVYYPWFLISTWHNIKYTKTLISSSQNDIRKIFNIVAKNVHILSIDHFFKFGPEIGKGKFGKVNFGLSIGKNERVAIKVIPKYKSKLSKDVKEDEDYYKTMKWEMDIFKYLKNAKNKNIISCIELFETSSYVYYVYECMYNGNLKAFIQENELSIFQKQDIVLQLLNGIFFLHSHGIIHRDIKYTNIMISRDKNKNGKIIVKIIDFGLSKVLWNNEYTLEPYGSLAFQAPELLLGGTMYSFKVDIWSWGVTFFYLLFKELPFDDKNPETLKDRILTDNISMEKLENISVKDKEEEKQLQFMVSLIYDCLEKNVNKRLNIYQILNKYFEPKTSASASNISSNGYKNNTRYNKDSICKRKEYRHKSCGRNLEDKDKLNAMWRLSKRSKNNGEKSHSKGSMKRNSLIKPSVYE